MMMYKDKWALVTGASAGLGLCYAEYLVEQGANVVLVARRKDRLDALVEQFNAKGVTAISIAADLAGADATTDVLEQLRTQNIHIDILINNAGFGLPGGYSNTTWQAQHAYIQLMLTSYCEFAHVLYSDMMDRGYGRIINIASVAGLVPASAGHTLYGPIKSFMISFSQSLSVEAKMARQDNPNHDVKCSAICPGFTMTEFHDVNGTRDDMNNLPSFMMMDARPVIVGSFKALEKENRVYVPGLVNKFIVWLSRSLPISWAEALMTNMTNHRRTE